MLHNFDHCCDASSRKSNRQSFEFGIVGLSEQRYGESSGVHVLDRMGASPAVDSSSGKSVRDVKYGPHLLGLRVRAHVLKLEYPTDASQDILDWQYSLSQLDSV